MKKYSKRLNEGIYSYYNIKPKEDKVLKKILL